MKTLKIGKIDVDVIELKSMDEVTDTFIIEKGKGNWDVEYEDGDTVYQIVK